MCKFYYLRYTCGHSTPHYYDATRKLYVKPCARVRRHNTCRIGSKYTNLDHDCCDCEDAVRRRIRDTQREAERIWSMSDEELNQYQTTEPWLGKPRFPYVVPRILIHRVPDLAPEPAVRVRRGFLAAPPKAYSIAQRQGQRKAWGGNLYRVVVNLETILCIIAPEFVSAAVVAAVAEAEAEAERCLLTRSTASVVEDESESYRTCGTPLAPEEENGSILLSLPANGESEKMTSWRRRVQARVWGKLDRLRYLFH